MFVVIAAAVSPVLAAVSVLKSLGVLLFRCCHCRTKVQQVYCQTGTVVLPVPVPCSVFQVSQKVCSQLVA